MAQLKSTVVQGALTVTGNVVANKLIKLGGTSSQILMADGNVKTIGSLITIPDITVTDNTNATTHPIVGDITASDHTITVTRKSLADLGLSTVYKYQGTKTWAQLLALTSAAVGDVYNISDEDPNGATGMDWACYKTVTAATTSSTYGTYWQSIGGTVDLTGYVEGPDSATDNAIARYHSTTGKVIQNSRATMDDTGNLKINNSDGGDISLILGRGSNADWRLLGSNGNFYIQGNYTTSKQTSFYDVLTLAYNSGNATIKGSVTANGFKHSNSTTGTDNYVLLAGGGTKALSDFAMDTEIPTVNNGTLTMSTSGTGVSGSATFTANQSTPSAFTVTLDSSAAGNRGANKVVLAKATGQIDSDKFTVTSSGTTKSTIQYNTTEGCLEFIFA